MLVLARLCTNLTAWYGRWVRVRELLPEAFTSARFCRGQLMRGAAKMGLKDCHILLDCGSCTAIEQKESRTPSRRGLGARAKLPNTPGSVRVDFSVSLEQWL